MYYRLQSGYVLRGWQGRAWVLVHRPDNETRILSREIFQALVLCDGVTDLTEDQLGSGLWAALQQCEEKGWIQPCETPRPLEKDQYYQYYENRFVNRIFWSVTGRCNFRCRHCYMDAPDAALGELSTREALDLIDQMAACGVLRVDLTGGEALVRKDFWQLVDRILSHGMVIRQLYTNGWLLDESVLDAFPAAGTTGCGAGPAPRRPPSGPWVCASGGGFMWGPACASTGAILPPCPRPLKPCGRWGWKIWGLPMWIRLPCGGPTVRATV